MSPGTAVGPVRSIDDLTDASELEPGTILVTKAPNPTLAPLYPMLGGLISESGDTLSPGLVSAREYSIPIVTGLRIDRSKLRDGSLVRIDGGSGQVQLLFGEEPPEGLR
jgi:pyruvate,water dikinase